MKKCHVAILIMVCFLAALFAGTASFAEKTKSGEVADEFIIKKTNIFKKHTKPGVLFTHKSHSVDLKIACADCHHHYEGDKNVWKEGDKVQKCDECHVTPKKNKGKTLSMYNAFHKNCRDCHKDEKRRKTKKPRLPPSALNATTRIKTNSPSSTGLSLKQDRPSIWRAGLCVQLFIRQIQSLLRLLIPVGIKNNFGQRLLYIRPGIYYLFKIITRITRNRLGWINEPHK